MSKTSRILTGQTPWAEQTVDHNYGPDRPFRDEMMIGHLVFDGSEVAFVEYWRFRDHHAARVITDDIAEELSETAFDRTQAEYEGRDRRGTPTFDFLDGDASDITKHF